MRGLYQQYAHPLARIVQGLPVSWDPVVATASAKGLYIPYVWSPCNRFIAVPKKGGVQILDAVTLEQLNTLSCPNSPEDEWLSFSPNGCFLTHICKGQVASWDLQTGGLVCTILSELQLSTVMLASSTYSMDGKMFAILYESDTDSVIATYDLFSGTYINSYCVVDGRIITPIWTCGEHFRFTVVKSGSVTIWEGGFTLTDPPTEVEALPVPDEIAGGEAYLFLPTLSQLAFTLSDTIVIWDTKSSKFLLNSGPITLQYLKPPHLSGAVFSSDGNFFIYLNINQEVYVWKRSITCYVLHQKLTISGNRVYLVPFISPSGRSFIVVIEEIIHLCQTEDQIPLSTHAPIYNPFTLKFSPQNEWAAFAQYGGKEVTVLYLQSSHPQLVIDTDTPVTHLGLTGSTIVVADQNKVATYNLPGGNSTSNTRMNIEDSVQAIKIKNTSRVLSISPNLNYIACETEELNDNKLEIYELSTGKCIVDATSPDYLYIAWFTVDGHTIWAEDHNDQLSGWKIIQDSESGVINLEPLEPHVSPPERSPWESSTCGYQIVDDVWVLSPTQKRLLWLPPHWRTDKRNRVWNGNFLGLRHPKPREVVILEFPE